MKKTSEEIEEITARTFAALRDSQPPAGMERRILQAMQDRPSSVPVWHRWPPLAAAARSWRIGVAGMAAVFLALSLAAFSVHRLKHNTHNIAESRQQPALINVPTPAQRVEMPERTVMLARTAITELASGQPSRSIEVLGNRTRARRPKPLSTIAALALSEMRAPSLPPPEMPLTEQEKLLQRIVHRGDPVELAELDPSAREAGIAADLAAFRNFFEPPKTEETTGEKE